MLEDTSQEQLEQPQPNLFILTLWQHEAPGADSTNGIEPILAGRVVHITSGKACTFLSPRALGTILLNMLDAERKEHRKHTSEEEEDEEEEMVSEEQQRQGTGPISESNASKQGASDGYLQQGEAKA